jgi:hypothetical protein
MTAKGSQYYSASRERGRVCWGGGVCKTAGGLIQRRLAPHYTDEQVKLCASWPTAQFLFNSQSKQDTRDRGYIYNPMLSWCNNRLHGPRFFFHSFFRVFSRDYRADWHPQVALQLTKIYSSLPLSLSLSLSRSQWEGEKERTVLTL